jgi:hypothetical protein
MKIEKKIEKEINQLMNEREQYEHATSWDYKYRYYILTGKIDILLDILRLRKVKLKDIESLKRNIQSNYKEIRKIPKHERNEYQYLEGIYLEGKLDMIETWVLKELSK